MHSPTAEQLELITRTDRGLTIQGTRITIYDVMDYVAANYPTSLISEKLCLTSVQVEAALSYIADHKTDVEAEYQQVLKLAEENRQYWQERNQKYSSPIAVASIESNKKAIYDKLLAWKDRLSLEA